MSELPSPVTAGGFWFVLAAALAVVVLWLVVRRWAASWSRRRKWSRARYVEADAPRVLAAQGYDVIGSQVPGSYTLSVDGQPLQVALRADYIVACRGRHFVAEVKSGRLAPQLSTAATRRQLLEYAMAFPVDGVLLVDGEMERVYEVEFPQYAQLPQKAAASKLSYAVACVATALLIAAYLRW